MKTKTIKKIQSLLRKEVDVINDNDAFRFITKALRLLDKEKQRKEQKKRGFKLFRHKGVKQIQLPANATVNETEQVIFEITVNYNKNEDPYSITPTGKVIINDGENFEELFMKLAKAYLDNKGENKIVIVR